jgi:Flp pilus assembly protein TadG
MNGTMTLRRKQSGVAAVELALVLPLLVLLVFGTFQFGRSLSYYNILVKSVRDGARHLTLYAPGDAARITEAKCLVVYGKFPCSNADASLVPGLALTNVSVCDRISCPGTHNLQSITDPSTGTIIGVANLVTISITGYSLSVNVGNYYGPDIFTFAPPLISETMVQVL